MGRDKKPEGARPKESAELSATDWTETQRTVSRAFPGPRGQQVLLRVAMERGAFAEVVAHAKESLDAEVCGVLAGDVCRDDEGTFVHVRAALRGAAAREGITHVTFTQETWNSIHEKLERDHPKLQIVGWYHSHPGFGVEFSDMDIFIQKNFFPAPTQIALVTDPLSGDAAICLNTDGGIRYVDRFWVDGREHRGRMPGGASLAPGAPAEAGDTTPMAGQISAMEARLTQLIQALDEQRTNFYRVLAVAFLFVCTAVAGTIGYAIYTGYKSRNEPPQLRSYVPLPIQVGDKTVLVGVGIAEWTVPPELNATYLQLEKEKRAAEEAAAAKAAAEKKDAPPPASPAPTPSK